MPSPQGEFTEPLRGADRSRAGHLWGRIGFVGLGLRCIAIGCWIPYLESEDTLVSGWKDYTLQAWVYKGTICKTWSA